MADTFKSFFKTVSGNEGSLCKYPTRLDLYGKGCSHDCLYCYAKSLLEFRGLWHPNNPAIADFDAVVRRIKRLEPGSVVRLGGMTDCFQPVEAQHKLTLNTIKVLNRFGIGYLIVTKSHLIAKPEYLDALDPELAHVQISVTNTDDDVARRYEKCSLTSKRLDAFARVQDRGIDCAVRLSPYVQGWIDLSKLAAYKPKKVEVEFLRVNHWIEKWFGDLADLSVYTLKVGNYRHLPLEKKIQAVSMLRYVLPDTQFSVCEDVPEHYQYWRDNVNPNKGDCCNLRMIAHAQV